MTGNRLNPKILLIRFLASAALRKIPRNGMESSNDFTTGSFTVAQCGGPPVGQLILSGTQRYLHSTS